MLKLDYYYEKALSAVLSLTTYKNANYVLLLKLLDLTAAVPKHQHFELLRS